MSKSLRNGGCGLAGCGCLLIIVGILGPILFILAAALAG